MTEGTPFSVFNDPEFEVVRQAFLTDTQTRLADMEQALIDLRRDRDQESLTRLVRGAHTLKGDAATVGLEAISQFAEMLQRSLEGLSPPLAAADPELVPALGEVVVLLREAVPRGLGGDDAPMAEVAALERRIARAAATIRALGQGA